MTLSNIKFKRKNCDILSKIKIQEKITKQHPVTHTMVKM